MTMPRLVVNPLCAAVALLFFSEFAARAAEPLSFNRDIRPILADACFPCHGPDPASRKAGLRFDREEDRVVRRGIQRITRFRLGRSVAGRRASKLEWLPAQRYANQPPPGG